MITTILISMISFSQAQFVAQSQIRMQVEPERVNVPINNVGYSEPINPSVGNPIPIWSGPTKSVWSGPGDSNSMSGSVSTRPSPGFCNPPSGPFQEIPLNRDMPALMTTLVSPYDEGKQAQLSRVGFTVSKIARDSSGAISSETYSNASGSGIAKLNRDPISGAVSTVNFKNTIQGGVYRHRFNINQGTYSRAMPASCNVPPVNWGQALCNKSIASINKQMAQVCLVFSALNKINPDPRNTATLSCACQYGVACSCPRSPSSIAAPIVAPIQMIPEGVSASGSGIAGQ